MSNAPDYETPGPDMDDAELATNIERLLRGWLDSCDRTELLDLHTYLGGAKKVHVKHQCPDCGEMIHADECPKEAPDFVCEYCHTTTLIHAFVANCYGVPSDFSAAPATCFFVKEHTNRKQVY